MTNAPSLTRNLENDYLITDETYTKPLYVKRIGNDTSDSSLIEIIEVEYLVLLLMNDSLRSGNGSGCKKMAKH